MFTQLNHFDIRATAINSSIKQNDFSATAATSSILGNYCIIYICFRFFMFVIYIDHPPIQISIKLIFARSSARFILILMRAFKFLQEQRNKNVLL